MSINQPTLKTFLVPDYCTKLLKSGNTEIFLRLLYLETQSWKTDYLVWSDLELLHMLFPMIKIGFHCHRDLPTYLPHVFMLVRNSLSAEICFISDMRKSEGRRRAREREGKAL